MNISLTLHNSKPERVTLKVGPDYWKRLGALSRKNDLAVSGLLLESQMNDDSLRAYAEGREMVEGA